MAGVTTAIVGFIFVCIVYPHLVKNRPQFYAALALVLLVILFDALAKMFGAEAVPGGPPASGFSRLMYVLSAFMQVGAILLLVLCAGGLTVRELASEAASAYEVIRRGDDTKTVIVPLRGEVPKPRVGREDAAPAPRSAPAAKPPTTIDRDSSLPLE